MNRPSDNPFSVTASGDLPSRRELRLADLQQRSASDIRELFQRSRSLSMVDTIFALSSIPFYTIGCYFATAKESKFDITELGRSGLIEIVIRNCLDELLFTLPGMAIQAGILLGTLAVLLHTRIHASRVAYKLAAYVLLLFYPFGTHLGRRTLHIANDNHELFGAQRIQHRDLKYLVKKQTSGT